MIDGVTLLGTIKVESSYRAGSISLTMRAAHESIITTKRCLRRRLYSQADIICRRWKDDDTGILSISRRYELDDK